MRLGAVPREVRLHLPDLLASRATIAPRPAPSTSKRSTSRWRIRPTRGLRADVNARMPGVFARRDDRRRRRRQHVPRARALSPRHRRRDDRRRHGVPAGAHDHAGGRAARDGRRAAADRPARARILMQVLLEGLLIAGAGALFGLVLALGSEGLINRFFQWRYDTALVFVASRRTSRRSAWRLRCRSARPPRSRPPGRCCGAAG